MKFRNAVIVAIEECQEISGEVFLVAWAQCADNAEVNRCILRFLRIVNEDKNVARMHIRMEKIVPKYLREKNLNAIFGQCLDVGSGFPESLYIADLCAENSFLNQHLGSTVIPVDVGNVK